MIIATLSAAVLPSAPDRPDIARAEGRPNVLLIVTDDQRWDTMEFMPRTKARIFDQGVSFSNAFATTPLCCPSRSSIFTGMYAGNHGVELNSETSNEDLPTFPEAMNDSGYYTGLVGVKYVNSWNPRHARPEFDFWSVGYASQSAFGASSMNVNGTDVEVSGYGTHVDGDYAQRFLEEAADQPDPFMLMFAPNAPHIPAVPAPGDENLYLDLPQHRPPSFDEADTSGKPAWVRSTRRLSTATIAEVDQTRLGQLQMLNSLDITISDLLDTLELQGRMDNTVVMFMSDNGYLWGEHRQLAKSRPYEESVRIPLAIRYPTIVQTPHVDDRIVANIDIAPTMYELAGLPIPPIVDGASLILLVRDDSNLVWRDDILLESREFSFNAVHTKDMVYIENTGDISELYDLRADPYQLQNLLADPLYDGIQADMLARLDRLKPRSVRWATRQIDSASYNVRYADWAGIVDDNASTEGMRSSTTAGGWIYGLMKTTDVGVILYRGPDQGKAQVRIDGIDQEIIDLYAPAPEYGFRVNYAGLSNAFHAVTLRVLGQRNEQSTGIRVTFDAFTANSSVIEDWDPRLNYTGWIVGRNEGAFTGDYHQTARRGARIAFGTVGTSATWITARGPSLEIAEVSVGGALTMIVDLYNPTFEWQHKVKIAGVKFRRQNVIISVTGRRNQNSTGTAIVFDGYSFP